MSTTPLTPDGDALVRIARIGRPHGIRGEVTVQVFTDEPETRFAPGEVLEVRDAPAGVPKRLTVTGARWNKQILVVAFAECPDRSTAEAWRDVQLYGVPLEAVEDDEWYEDDLMGLEVRVDGRRVGEVTALITGTVQDLLQVALDGVDTPALIPFVEEIVPEVDVEAGTVTLTPPPGLLELATGEADTADTDAAEAPAGER